MKNIKVVEQTYEWLTTAFGSDLNLSKEEKIKKAELVKKLCIEEIDEYIEALKNDNQMETLNACADLLVVASNLPFYAGIDLNDLLVECDDTFSSNMTKFCKTEQEAKETVELYKAGNHPNKPGIKVECDYRKTNHKVWKYKIVSIPDEKILKSKGFKDVNYFRS